ncbi:MAG: ATP phosphoribosyltransferase [Alphaproteobacteria bacterium]|nr:ATP phosphoribosyltransferase [Alphaproteobacteria bacterium]|tara:strand:+ start:2622 stop:3284 length:663 start_codon:yes stop_codon:yes gene_type:complete
MTIKDNDGIVLAIPKGRILKELIPVLNSVGISIEPSFSDKDARQLQFSTNIQGLSVIRVRSFDVATFVAFGAAHLGVAGADVLMEFNYNELYEPLDLGIARCRLIVAEPKVYSDDDPAHWSHVRVATKYPRLTKRHFEARGVQAECIKLNGAMELAPKLGLCRRIVDLTHTGETLKANGLAEIEHIADVTSRLVVNRAALKTRANEINSWIQKFREVVNG